ncbi:deoxyribose-phosphate aldolase [mine drainage metagenome]|uniref:deoxyribose-phosphate aldolase n=1 Tax=mine drainage metagenome TaxID=410659 RepID=A0A1J5TQL8_9ZZZZ
MVAEKNIIAIPDFRYSTHIDHVGVEERASRFTKRSIKAETKLNGLKLTLNMIDLTTLEGKDTEGKVKQLCYKAQHLHDTYPGLPTVAAICVYPSMVSVAKKALSNSGINVASVATAFPSGQASRDVKIRDVKYAVNNGADEIDMVISRGKFLQGDYNFVFDEIAAVKEACGPVSNGIRLKVILETGELVTYDNVRKASDIAMYAGADFIKTSTGKVTPAATMPVTLVMLEAIRDFYYKTGKMIAMKPAGGISKSKLALHYLVMLQETLGDAWMNNHWFRFGASSLANDVLMQLEKERTGVYQSSNYFSID